MSSQAWRRVCEVELPVWMRGSLYRAFTAVYDGDPEEAAGALEDYPSLQAPLFLSSLRRAYAAAPYTLVMLLESRA